MEVSEAVIRQNASAQSYERGEDYYGAGAVISLARRGEVIQAEVLGSHYEPYRVQVMFDQAGTASAACDCPYDWGGWCKHIVAVLLTCIHDPREIEEKRPLEEILEGLSAAQMKSLLQKLAEDNPKLSDQIESQAALLFNTDSQR